MIRILLLIGTGGFVGSILRYLIGQWLQGRVHSTFPCGTLAVNVAGCFVLGLLLGWSLRSQNHSHWHFFLATGLCGGFTTFSAFSAEALTMMRTGLMAEAMLYIGLSVVLGLAVTYVGVWIAR